MTRYVVDSRALLQIASTGVRVHSVPAGSARRRPPVVESAVACLARPRDNGACLSAPSSNMGPRTRVGRLQHRLARVEPRREDRRARPGDARVLSGALPASRDLAGMAREFDAAGPLEVVEDKVGTGSVDFWGISFSPSSTEQGPMERGRARARDHPAAGLLGVLRRRRGSGLAGDAQGAPGGGRDRDRIIRHTIRTESEDFAKQVGLRIPEEAALTPEGLRQHREGYVAAMRAYNAGEVAKRMRSWTLPFLIRHSAFHTLDHAWEMEDKDLSGADGA